jgi:hypothetical protein
MTAAADSSPWLSPQMLETARGWTPSIEKASSFLDRRSAERSVRRSDGFLLHRLLELLERFGELFYELIKSRSLRGLGIAG